MPASKTARLTTAKVVAAIRHLGLPVYKNDRRDPRPGLSARKLHHGVVVLDNGADEGDIRRLIAHARAANWTVRSTRPGHAVIADVAAEVDCQTVGGVIFHA